MARSSVFAPHRLAIAGVVVLLAVLAFLFLRGPESWQRLYHPLPEQHRSVITESALRHRVNPYLVAAVIEAESDWRPDVVSKAGAVGLMQILPETAEDLARTGYVDTGALGLEPGTSIDRQALTDPAVNIEFGTAYLRFLVERYHEIEPALAAYNAGMRNADAWFERGEDIRESIEFPETRHYVLRVARARDVYERLYPDAFPEWSE